MRELNVNEVEQVNGGCEEHCWNDFSTEDLSSAVSAGGLISPAAGVITGGIYLLSVMWFDMKE
jgi:hypothetical protein